MARIFISYSSRDSAQADACYTALTERGHEVWMDRAELRGGEEWVQIIQDKIRWSQAMIVLWSANALQSDWVGREITFGETLDKKIIPIQIDETLPQENIIINALQTIDARQREFDVVAAMIEQSISGRPILASASSVTRHGVSLPRQMIVVGGLLLVVIAAVLLASATNVLTTVEPTPTAVPETATATPPAPTLTAETLDQAATLALLNDWRLANGLAALDANPLLGTVAEQHASYLRSLPLQELEGTNVFRNADGQDVVFMAGEVGYDGDVTMVVEITDDQVTLENLLTMLDDQGDYSDAGLQQVRSIATNNLYFVLVLGAGRRRLTGG